MTTGRRAKPKKITPGRRWMIIGVSWAALYLIAWLAVEITKLF